MFIHLQKIHFSKFSQYCNTTGSLRYVQRAAVEASLEFSIASSTVTSLGDDCAQIPLFRFDQILIRNPFPFQYLSQYHILHNRINIRLARLAHVFLKQVKKE